MSNKKLLAGFACSALFLAACSQTATETIHDHLEQAAEIENEGFDTQQQPLVDAEERGTELYSQIVELDMDQFEEIVELADQAIETVNERRELISTEQESIEEGFSEFENAEASFEDLEDDELKVLAEEMQTAMNERHGSYQTLYTLYNEALNLDEQLYEMLKDEELDVDTLTGHIDTTNEKYEELQEATNNFNDYTTTYNDAKRAFYEASDLEVRFE